MMTFRAGAAGAASDAALMAAHLLTETTPRPAQELAAYYRGDGEALALAELRRGVDPQVARVLGLAAHRPPDTDEIENLLRGRRTDGEVIAGKRQAAPGASRSPISFYDCTFSSPKSVSVAWALAPTEAERAAIVHAHREAVDAAMQEVAAHLGQARIKGGRGGREPGSVAWLKFEHFTARPVIPLPSRDAEGKPTTEHIPLPLRMPGDPNLHTHVVVPNVTVTEDGRVAALDTVALHNRVHLFGAIYQAHLSQGLRRLGVTVELDQRTGTAHLPAIPRDVCEAFSKRTNDATTLARQFAEANGAEWDALSPEDRISLLKRGAGIGRQNKQARSDDLSDLAAWRTQAEAIGWQHGGVIGHAAPPVALSREKRAAIAYAAALPLLEAELERRAVLTAHELRVIAARGLIMGGLDAAEDAEDVLALMRERGVRQDGAETRLVELRGAVTTARHIGREQDLVRLAQAAGQDRAGALSGEQVAAAIARHPELDFSDAHGQAQRAAMERLGTGGRLAVAIGSAGSGKSSMLSPLVDAWHADGRNVWGASLAWRQADDLADTGIPAARRFALAPFLDRAERGRIALGRNSVVVLDELGLVGTRDMVRLLILQERTGCRLVAVGDERQCQAVSAGPVIDLLRRALGPGQVPEILSSVRQEAERDRETARLFREGKAAEALARKREDGTALVVPGGYRDAVQRAADLWDERTQANADDAAFRLAVTAPTNADARAISAAIRGRRRARGDLGPDVTTAQATDQHGAAYALPLAIGDRVRLFAATGADFGGKGGIIGRNGSVLEVLAIDGSGLTLRNAKGKAGHVSWKALADPVTGRIRLAHGDALTVDASQGLTATEAINAMPAGTRSLSGHKAYVAESRHRRTAWLVTSDGAERAEIMSHRPLGDSRPVTEADLFENMARNLSRQPTKQSALALAEEAREAAAGALRALHAGLRPAEERERQGKTRTTLHRTFARHRMQALAAEVARRFAPRLHALVARQFGRVQEHEQSEGAGLMAHASAKRQSSRSKAKLSQ